MRKKRYVVSGLFLLSVISISLAGGALSYGVMAVLALAILCPRSLTPTFKGKKEETERRFS